MSALLLASSCTGITKMGLRFKVDIFGAKADLRLPLEFYPLTADGGYPPEGIVCE